MVGALAAVAGIILANAFFVAAEYSLVTSRRSALAARVERGSRGARVALRLMDDPVRVISAVQIAITGLGILLGAIGQPAFAQLLDPPLATGAAFLAGFILITYLSVAFGELVPKALALHGPERMAVLVAVPIDLLTRLLTPIVWLLQGSVRAALRPLGIEAVTAGDRPATREELRAAVEEAAEHGSLRGDEREMLAGVIDLRAREVRDIMAPWDDVATIDATEQPGAILDQVAASAHSRYPAVEGRGGPIVGVLHARDLWAAVHRGATPPLPELLRPPVIVPPTLDVDGLLRQLRRVRQQLAVVVNEYGQPLGIATIEDVVEEVVGEIEDEFDTPDARVERTGEGLFEVDAAISISDFNRISGAELEPDRAHSVGGAVFEALGRRPALGDEVDLDSAHATVLALDGHRIEQVRVLLGPSSGAPPVP